VIFFFGDLDNLNAGGIRVESGSGGVDAAFL
jgi:hypothetical protein